MTNIDIGCNIYNIHLYGSKITDINGLSNAWKICFHSCNYIKDVSALANVYQIKFDHCDIISDVNKLNNIYII